MSLSVGQEHQRLCIEANKVYDWCYRRFDHTFEKEFQLPGSGRDVQLITCEINDVAIQELSRTVGPNGIATLVLAKIVDYTLTLWELVDAALQVKTTEDFTVVFPETFSICAPEGTTISSHTVASTCQVLSVTPALPAETGADKKVKILLEFVLCQSVQSLAPVKVCVPIEGLCTPKTNCDPVITCPPPNQIFPPDCGVNLCPPVAG